ncbi:ABC transporter substrate-binding protein [Phenylobacterium sp. J367]|uniref:substrate-binding periplasmic protein n=1 Tax=Phenylobacterium sp. J367 TaxID=2898435 RepID=UPI002150DE92|nr:transporter substrate-binding domain-containing protein [Phenylobacterium sp. J367]MCR5880672.1 transporter substrate-binding domain-containing protein [Phenylobacterium sp. J367]
MTSRLRGSRRAVLAGLGASAMAAGCAPRSEARRTGGVVVGSTATGVPFSFYDVRTNTLTGAMVDIVKAVAAQAAMPVEVQVTAFSALIPSLTVGKIDLIAAAMLRTPAREAVVDFSDPVYAYGGAVVVPADDPGAYPDLARLAGRRVGAQVGSRFVDQLAEAGVGDVRTYDNLADILRDLRLGRLDAAYGDEPIIRYYLRVTRTRALRLAPEFAPGAREQVCLIMRKGETELAARLNTAIAAIKDTRIAAIVKAWGL